MMANHFPSPSPDDARRPPASAAEWYRAIVEEHAELIARFTPDTVLTYVNDEYCRWFNRRREELLGTRFLTLLAEADRAATVARLAQLSRQNPIVYNEERVVSADGKVRWQQWINRGLFDEAGRMVEVQSVGRDITERKRLEEALRASEERFRVAFEEAPVGMVIGVGDGVIAEVNRALCRISDYAPEELVGRHVRDFTHPEDLEVSAPLLRQLFSREIPSFTVEKRYLAKGGRVFWARATTAAVYDAEGRLAFALGIIEDITARKRAQEAAERERQTLWRMLQASDHERQLIAYEIHDGLAQQLAAALMQFQTHEHLSGQRPEEAKTAYEAGVQMLRQAHAEARRLISGVRPPVLDESGIETAIAHLVHDQRAAGGPAVEYHSEVAFDRLPRVLENGLYRIAQEALANAARHSRSGKIRVALAQDGDQVTLEVRDWGVGFDVENVASSRFGLEGIRQRTRLLGGEVRIESAWGEGSTVFVRLPLAGA